MINYSEQLIFLLTWLSYQSLPSSLCHFFVIIGTDMTKNFQSLPWWEAPGGPDTEKSCCFRNHVLILDVLLFSVKTAQTQDYMSHGADSCAHWSQWELKEVEANKLKRISKNKNKTASDTLTYIQSLSPWDLHFFITLSNCDMAQRTRNYKIRFHWWSSSQSCMRKSCCGLCSLALPMTFQVEQREKGRKKNLLNEVSSNMQLARAERNGCCTVTFTGAWAGCRKMLLSPFKDLQGPQAIKVQSVGLFLSPLAILLFSELSWG